MDPVVPEIHCRTLETYLGAPEMNWQWPGFSRRAAATHLPSPEIYLSPSEISLRASEMSRRRPTTSGRGDGRRPERSSLRPWSGVTPAGSPGMSPRDLQTPRWSLPMSSRDLGTSCAPSGTSCAAPGIDCATPGMGCARCGTFSEALGMGSRRSATCSPARATHSHAPGKGSEAAARHSTPPGGHWPPLGGRRGASHPQSLRFRLRGERPRVGAGGDGGEEQAEAVAAEGGDARPDGRHPGLLREGPRHSATSPERLAGRLLGRAAAVGRQQPAAKAGARGPVAQGEGLVDAPRSAPTRGRPGTGTAGRCGG